VNKSDRGKRVCLRKKKKTTSTRGREGTENHVIIGLEQTSTQGTTIKKSRGMGEVCRLHSAGKKKGDRSWRKRSAERNGGTTVTSFGSTKAGSLGSKARERNEMGLRKGCPNRKGSPRGDSGVILLCLLPYRLKKSEGKLEEGGHTDSCESVKKEETEGSQGEEGVRLISHWTIAEKKA